MGRKVEDVQVGAAGAAGASEGAGDGSARIAGDILERIRGDGGRVTATRRLIVEAMLDAASHHLTANDIVDAVRRRDPAFHRSTVYRTLDRLTELGVVDRMQIGAGPAVYHLSHRPHHHLVCDRCGSVQEAPADVLDPVVARLARAPGFVVNPAATPLHGLCASCATPPKLRS